MSKISSANLAFFTFLLLSSSHLSAQNFTAAEAGGFKRLDVTELKEFFSKEQTLRRVGTGQNDDLIFKSDGQHFVVGYTRSFEERGTWSLKENEVCWNLPSSKRCRFLYLNAEKWRLVSDTGEIRAQGMIKK